MSSIGANVLTSAVLQMEDYMPDDWQEAPPKLVARISDPIYRRFALELNDRWKILSRKISDEVRNEV